MKRAVFPSLTAVSIGWKRAFIVMCWCDMNWEIEFCDEERKMGEGSSGVDGL